MDLTDKALNAILDYVRAPRPHSKQIVRDAVHFLATELKSMEALDTIGFIRCRRKAGAIVRSHRLGAIADRIEELDPDRKSEQ